MSLTEIAGGKLAKGESRTSPDDEYTGNEKYNDNEKFYLTIKNLTIHRV